MVDRTGLFVKPLPGSPAQGTSPTDGRLVLGALFGTNGGCHAGGTFIASTTQMQVSVTQSVWRIPDPTNSYGVYLSPADPALLLFSAGPASGSRIDVLWVRQNNYEAGDANSRVVYGVAAGVAASNPVAPAIPAGAMKIGQLTVPAGASNAAACTLVTTFGMSNVEVRPTMRGTAQLNNAASVSIPTSAWTNLPFDTTLSDPLGAFAPSYGSNVFLFRTPYSGLYRIDARVAFAGGDVPDTAALRVVAESGTVLSSFAQKGAAGDQLLSFSDVFLVDIASPNKRNPFLQAWQNSGSNRGVSYGDDSVRLRATLQYLGPS